MVYLDRVLLLNLLVDYLLLLTTAQLAGIPLRRGRLALCAAVGALYAGAVFLPGLSWLSHPLCRTAVGAEGLCARGGGISRHRGAEFAAGERGAV